MKEDKKIKKYIKKINKRCPKPQCYLVALLLTSKFGGTIYYDNDHCVSLINHKFWDKKGEFPGHKVLMTNFLPLDDYGWGIKKKIRDSIN